MSNNVNQNNVTKISQIIQYSKPPHLSVNVVIFMLTYITVSWLFKLDNVNQNNVAKHFQNSIYHTNQDPTIQQ